MINKHNSVYDLYPQVVTIRGDKAYDADDNEVAIDLAAVEAHTPESERVAIIQAERDNKLDALSAATGRRNTTLQALGMAILSKKIKGIPLTAKEEAMEAQLEAMAAKVDAIDEVAEQAITDGTPADQVAWPT